MQPLRTFISSVQSEFAQERAALRDYIHDLDAECSPEELEMRFEERLKFRDELRIAPSGQPRGED